MPADEANDYEIYVRPEQLHMCLYDRRADKATTARWLKGTEGYIPSDMLCRKMLECIKTYRPAIFPQQYQGRYDNKHPYLKSILPGLKKWEADAYEVHENLQRAGVRIVSCLRV